MWTFIFELNEEIWMTEIWYFFIPNVIQLWMKSVQIDKLSLLQSIINGNRCFTHVFYMIAIQTTMEYTRHVPRFRGFEVDLLDSIKIKMRSNVSYDSNNKLFLVHLYVITAETSPPSPSTFVNNWMKQLLYITTPKPWWIFFFKAQVHH